jgi:hypothetical protein
MQTLLRWEPRDFDYIGTQAMLTRKITTTGNQPKQIRNNV